MSLATQAAAREAARQLTSVNVDVVANFYHAWLLGKNDEAAAIAALQASARTSKSPPRVLIRANVLYEEFDDLTAPGGGGGGGADGREVELRVTATHVQWRYVGGVWQNLLALADLVGPTGPEGPRGIQGIQGTQGLQGLQGIQGLQGAQGQVGPPGSDATVTDSAVANQVSTGATTQAAIAARVAGKLDKSTSVTQAGASAGWLWKLMIDYTAATTDPEPIMVQGMKSGTSYRAFWLNESGNPRAQSVVNEPALKLYGPSSNFSYAGDILHIENHFDASGRAHVWSVKANGATQVGPNKVVVPPIIVLNAQEAVPSGLPDPTIIIRRP